MLQSMIRPHDHICAILSLWVHSALESQLLPGQCIHKIADHRRCTYIKSRKTDFFLFSADIQDLISCTDHIPFFCFFSAAVKLRCNFSIRQNRFFHIQLFCQPLPFRAVVSCLRFLKNHFFLFQIRPERNRSLHSFCKDLLFLASGQCIYFKVTVDFRLTCKHHVIFYFNTTFPALSPASARCIRNQLCFSFRLKDPGTRFHQDLLFLPDKFYSVHFHPSDGHCKAKAALPSMPCTDNTERPVLFSLMLPKLLQELLRLLHLLNIHLRRSHLQIPS